MTIRKTTLPVLVSAHARLRKALEAGDNARIPPSADERAQTLSN